ncbi:general secretion pathway protein M [Sphingobium fontiphilum]|uniref:General secretion pathway protein M n=1 Tax=Sphingobium fontiphilum TaxID=944425 RepID=A0A7W6DL82_9SPHN|nr:type II secretion system protein GspM [Sphingobium fontiphilum]MBB3981089.1 general secretion pathway protein M [Sphingobium fontiphilum]
MMDSFKAAWAARSPREQWMLGVMFALLALVILWLGIARPVERAWTNSRAAMLAAADANAAIRAKVKMLKQLPASAPARDGTPMDQLVGQSAAEAGLTLERADAQGADRMDIAMASVRPVALFGWLAGLEAQGIRVETLSARPAPTAGSVAVQAVLAR